MSIQSTINELRRAIEAEKQAETTRKVIESKLVEEVEEATGEEWQDDEEVGYGGVLLKRKQYLPIRIREVRQVIDPPTPRPEPVVDRAPVDANEIF